MNLIFFNLDAGCNAGQEFKCLNDGLCLKNGICECKSGFRGITCREGELFFNPFIVIIHL